jgi:hypothetical protein
MNVQLANVISDISGLTGQAILRAIVAGERNPLKLATQSIGLRCAQYRALSLLDFHPLRFSYGVRPPLHVIEVFAVL